MLVAQRIKFSTSSRLQWAITATARIIIASGRSVSLIGLLLSTLFLGSIDQRT